MNKKRKAPRERNTICSKISKRDENSAVEALVAISSSDLFHGKSIAELEAAEALTSFGLGSDKDEIPTPECYDTVNPNSFESDQNITTDTSSQVTTGRKLQTDDIFTVKVPPLDTWLVIKIHFS